MSWVVILIFIVVYVATGYFDKHGDEDTVGAKAATGILGCFMTAVYLIALIGGIAPLILFLYWLFN